MPYKNKEDRVKRGIEYRKENAEKIKEKKHQDYILHSEEVKERVKLWGKNNPDKVKGYKLKWGKNNKLYRNEYVYNRRKTDLKFNLNQRMSCLIRQSLKNNKTGRHWETLVGYIVEDLLKRLKSTMPEGYTWQDYMEGRLHIDHKIPISAFNYDNTNNPDFERCWSLDNLRLLPARENVIKSNHLTEYFQPALKLSIAGVM